MRLRHLCSGSLVVAAAFTFTGSDLEAQIPLSIVAGPNFTTVSTDDFDTATRTGFFAGIGTSVALNEKFAFQPYVAYVQRGAEFEGGSSGTDTYTYIDIATFLSTGRPLSESVTLIVSAGPRISFNLSCTEEEPGEEDDDCKDFFDYTGGTDFGLLGSLGLQFPMGANSFSVGAGYDLGLSDIFENIDGGFKNRGFYLFGAYGFQLGGA